MLEHSSIYKNYQKYNYNNYSINRYNGHNFPTFTPMHNYFYEQSNNYNNNFVDNKNSKNNTFENIDISNHNNCKDTFSEKRENKNTKNFRIGPLQIEDNNIDIFGFSLAIDDLIIIVLIILLFFQSDKDYTLIIILGLMLFNISFSNLDFLRGL